MVNFLIKLMACLGLALVVNHPARLQSTPPSVWRIMRSEFRLNHQLNRPEVQQQLKWLQAHPGYLKQLAQSKPYIYHIVTEIKKRHLPGEFALIPLIESSYDPFAYSGAGAAGLWQIMPETSRDLGLSRDWWADHRRSITPSTNAALNYLTYLHQYFHGNWELAVAAYDAGEGTVSRAAKRARHRGRVIADFWSLSLPQETRLYVPRLMALAEIVAHPSRYHIKLPFIPHIPFFAEINVNSRIDLSHAAKLAGMNYQDFIKLNPGFNRLTTTPYRPFTLLIPTERVDFFYQNLAVFSHETKVSLVTHHVHEGDTLAQLAKQYGTTTPVLKALNQLHYADLHPGQTLLIPIQRTVLKNKLFTPTVQTYPTDLKVVHIVQPHETMAHIAKKYHVSAQQIREWNHIGVQEVLATQQALIIWKKLSATA